MQRQIAVARTLGYRPRGVVVARGLAAVAPRLAWPLLAVLAYGADSGRRGADRRARLAADAGGAGVAVAADADVARNTQGAAAALAARWRAGAARGGAACVALARSGGSRVRRGRRRRARASAPTGPARARARRSLRPRAASMRLSCWRCWRCRSPASGPSPRCGRRCCTAAAWAQVAHSQPTVAFTAVLALAASASALVLAVAWLEAAPPHWDAAHHAAAAAPLVLPGLLLMVGLYQGALALRHRRHARSACGGCTRCWRCPMCSSRWRRPGAASTPLRVDRARAGAHAASPSGGASSGRCSLRRSPRRGGRLCRQRGAVPAHAVHRRGAPRHRDDRGGDARARAGSARWRRRSRCCRHCCRRWPSAWPRWRSGTTSVMTPAARPASESRLDSWRGHPR